MRFKGKVALITGGSRGIGKATAIKFAKEGADVVINYFSSKEEADEIIKELTKIGSDALAIQADVSKESEVTEMFKEIIAKYKRLDVLFANAGVISPKDPFELTAEDFKKTLDTNLVGVFLCVREAGKIMKKQKFGKIVCNSSIRGLEHCGREGATDYAASKAGVISIVKTFARKLGPEITINAIAPGFIEPGMVGGWTPEIRRRGIEESCLKRLGNPDDIANAVSFLASDDTSFITGHVLVVDGGYNLK